MKWNTNHDNKRHAIEAMKKKFEHQLRYLSHETALRTSSNCPGQEGEAHLSDIKPSR